MKYIIYCFILFLFSTAFGIEEKEDSAPLELTYLGTVQLDGSECFKIQFKNISNQYVGVYINYTNKFEQIFLSKGVEIANFSITQLSAVGNVENYIVIFEDGIPSYYPPGDGDHLFYIPPLESLKRNICIEHEGTLMDTTSEARMAADQIITIMSLSFSKHPTQIKDFRSIEADYKIYSIEDVLPKTEASKKKRTFKTNR